MNRFLIVLLMVCSAYTRVLSQDHPNSVPQPREQTNAAQTQKISPNPTPPVADFIIGPQDVLFINVWREPDFTATVTVRSDGKISLPLLNDIQAGGLTTNELQKRITEGLDKFVREPQVAVIVQKIHGQIVQLIGSVARPGTYDIGGPTSVMQLLARAGGLAEWAKSREIMIVRTDAGKARRFRFNYDSFISGENVQQNISVHAGDMIIVP